MFITQNFNICIPEIQFRIPCIVMLYNSDSSACFNVKVEESEQFQQRGLHSQGNVRYSRGCLRLQRLTYLLDEGQNENHKPAF